MRRTPGRKPQKFPGVESRAEALRLIAKCANGCKCGSKKWIERNIDSRHTRDERFEHRFGDVGSNPQAVQRLADLYPFCHKIGRHLETLLLTKAAGVLLRLYNGEDRRPGAQR